MAVGEESPPAYGATDLCLKYRPFSLSKLPLERESGATRGAD